MYSGHTLHALRCFKAGSLSSQSFMKIILHGTWIAMLVPLISRKEMIRYMSASVTARLMRSRNF